MVTAESTPYNGRARWAGALAVSRGGGLSSSGRGQLASGSTKSEGETWASPTATAAAAPGGEVVEPAREVHS